MKQIKDDNEQGNGYPISRDLTARLFPIADCKPLGRSTRKHSPRQVAKIAANLKRFGVVLPILIDPEGRVVHGWALVLAAQKLGLRAVPSVKLTDLSEAQLRALRLALNRLNEDSGWDREALKLELSDIVKLEPIDLESTGFEMGEIDLILDGNGAEQEDELPNVENRGPPVSQAEDLWTLGEHSLCCGDALSSDPYARLLGSDKAQMMFTDPPYNVPILGHVSGLGKVKHKDFAVASGELAPAEYVTFLKTSLGHAAKHSINGSIHFICIDWRHVRELSEATEPVYDHQLNLCVWKKTNAGMGSLYRSGHELVLVFKVVTPRISTMSRSDGMVAIGQTSGST